jgi:Domain of unknown function (DUF1707)
MNGVPGDYPARDLRVSDADRDRAVSELSEHFQAGRLTSDEFDERSGLALRARTGSDLAALFADLPRPQAPAAPPAPRPGAPVAHRSRLLLAAPAAIALSVLLSALLTRYSGHLTISLVPAVIVLLVALRLGRGGRWRGGRRELR